MRKFIVNVNGASYEVEVEEITGAASAPVPVRASAALLPPLRQLRLQVRLPAASKHP